MNKNLKLWFLCCLSLCLCSGSLMAGKLVIFVNGGVGSGSKTESFHYNSNYHESHFGFSLVDSGGIESQYKTGKVFSGGVIYYITPNFGLSLSLSHSKRDIQLDANYQTLGTLDDGTKIMDETASWEDTGTLKVTPFNFNVTYRLRLFKNLSINVNTGLSLFRYKANLPSHMGFSAVNVHYYPDDKLFVPYPDWIDFDVFIKRESSHQLGYNIGMELEQKLTSWLGISGGFHYFKTAKKEFRWEVIKESTYYGQLGNVILGEVPGRFYENQLVQEIDLSFLQVYLGFKFYL